MQKALAILVVLLVLALAIVFFTPSMHPEPTALRAARHAALVFLAIVLAVGVAGFHVAHSMAKIGFVFPRASKLASPERGLLDLSCCRLC